MFGNIVQKYSAPLLAAGAVWLSSALGAPAAADSGYAVEFSGGDRSIRTKLALISDLNRGLREYPTIAALRRAARRDVKSLNAGLHAAGYYLGKARYEIDRGDETTKPTVRFILEPGPAFEVIEYEILYRDDILAKRPTSLLEAEIDADGSASGTAIRDLQFSFLNYLWDSGFPSARSISRRAIALPDQAQAHAVFVYESGPKARFGKIEISGLKKTKPEHIGKLISWETGEDYERSKIITFRDRLAQTGLFTAIDIAPGALDEKGEAPIIVELTERKHRTIGAGVSYSTANGPGGRVFLENRNVFGSGERLRIEVRASEIEQSIDFTTQKPLLDLPGYGFLNFGFKNETTEAFDARSVNIAAGLAKNSFEDRLTLTGALGLETSKVERDGVEERTYFLSAPLSVLWNSEDDLLAPKKGFKASFTVTPYTGTETFTQAELNARSRVFITKNDRVTFATRVGLGATFGNSLLDLPANKRFFVGGGGSVRGYAFQEAGPIDTNGDPIGGRSYAIGAIEIRGRATEKIEIVGFADAGAVMSSSLPRFDERFFIGAGGGARYLTPIGPLRIDVGFPLNKRPTDSTFQLYIALGQPF